MFRNSLITRHGVLNFKDKEVPNQCAFKGHDVYHYELKVLFSNKTQLDQNGFIIDHHIFNDVIQQVSINSCEVMSIEILNSIEKVLTERNLTYVGMKLKIKPAFVIEQDSAYFTDYRYHRKSDFVIVMNL